MNVSRPEGFAEREAKQHAEYQSAQQEQQQADPSRDALNVGDKPKIQLPPIRTAAEMSSNPAPQRPEIIMGLLKQCSKMAIGGASKARKTWLLIHLGVCVSRGDEWLKFKTNQTKVLYVNFELHADTFEKRLDLICEACETDPATLGDQFAHWCLRGHAASFDQILPIITQEIKDKGYGLIIIDPMYKILGDADENKAGDITRLMNELERVAFNSKASVVTANHYSKGNKSGAQDGDRISGSGVFQRDPDALLEFVDQADSGDDNNILSVRARLREFKPMTPFCVEWDGQSLFQLSMHDATKLKATGGRRQEHTLAETLDVLEDGMTTTEWQEAADADKGISRSTFFELKKKALEEGEVSERKERREGERRASQRYYKAAKPAPTSAARTNPEGELDL
jgi:RecA-family ATPase